MVALVHWQIDSTHNSFVNIISKNLKHNIIITQPDTNITQQNTCILFFLTFAA